MNHVNDFQGQINRYFDQDAQAANQVNPSTDADPAVNPALAKEMQMKSLIKSNFQRTHVSPELIQSIKNKIQVF